MSKLQKCYTNLTISSFYCINLCLAGRITEMNITSIVYRIYFQRRYEAIERYRSGTESIQKNVLEYLVNKASGTQWGKEHGYQSIHCYGQFVENVPVSSYNDLKGYIRRMMNGEKDVLWPGRVRNFAKSSGTTNDKSKFIPVSCEGLENQFSGGRDCVACYLHANPESRMFSNGGKSLILGGCHYCMPGTQTAITGDLSAILIDNIPALVNLSRVPDKKTALLADFEQKCNRIAYAARSFNVTNISGLPSWMLSVLKHTLDVNGVNRIDGIWPNLEVFFHGGVAFNPYREQFRNIITLSGMHYMETYNASEGFFGIQTDLEDTAMTLMIDYKVFYEFCPVDNIDETGEVLDGKLVVPLWEVETGRNYAMIISTACGLWRYLIGDTVRFTRRDPYKFIITGRTGSFINIFGEKLIVGNAENGLLKACAATGAQVKDYTVAPVFSNDDSRARYQWLIEFSNRPDSIEEFSRILDIELQAVNSLYEKVRINDIFLQPLEVIEARPGLFDDWLKSKGKLGGQHKIPRLSNSRQVMEELIAIN